MKTARWAAVLLAFALVLAGCSSSDSDSTNDGEDAVPVPRGFDVPAGVTLTQGGTRLAVPEPASVVYEVGAAASAVTVAVTRVKKGSIKDFRFFNLDDQTKASTPYYVSVTVKNDGPAGLGGASLPILAHDSTDTVFQANAIVGTFKPCRPSVLPKSFLPGATAKLCLVYLVPKGRTLESVDLQTGASADAVSWTP